MFAFKFDWGNIYLGGNIYYCDSQWEGFLAACAHNGIGSGRAVPGLASRFRGTEQDDPILDLAVDSTCLAV